MASGSRARCKSRAISSPDKTDITELRSSKTHGRLSGRAQPAPAKASIESGSPAEEATPSAKA